MSYNAQRFRTYNDYSTERRSVKVTDPNHPEQMTRHHVPPRVSGRARLTLKKKRKEHEAYHLLMHGAPKTREEAIAIFIRDWWTDEKGNLID